VTDLATRRARTLESGHTAGRRRPWWVWAAPVAAILAVLLGRNTDLFTGRFYETADYGADSIQVEQARRLTLLVGNYSRDHFHHPGPAYLYIEAAGQSVFYNALHWVPTAWNGQVIALYALNAALAGLIVLVVYGWAGYRGALAATALLLGFAVLHVGVLSAAWLPYQDVPAFALFLIAAGSVAAGRPRDAWIAALAGWLLIHRYASMLLFVPLLTAVVLILAIWPHRRRMRAALRELASARSAWIPAAAVSAVFALPIVINLILHWPGDFGSYLTYSKGSTAGAHGAGTTTRYVLWFWGPGNWGWAALAALAAAAAVAIRLTRGPLRRYLAALGTLGVVATAATVYYAATGIDEIDQQYIAYFYWAVPLLAALIAALAATAALPSRVSTALAALAAAAGVAAFAVAPGTRTSTTHVDPEFASGTITATDQAIPRVVRELAADAHGAPVVIYTYQGAWPALTGVLAETEREGVRACVASPGWVVMVTSQLICTHAELAHGTGFLFHPAGTRVKGAIATLNAAVITPYQPSAQRLL
jgi:hypothetical protein